MFGYRPNYQPQSEEAQCPRREPGLTHYRDDDNRCAHCRVTLTARFVPPEAESPIEVPRDPKYETDRCKCAECWEANSPCGRTPEKGMTLCAECIKIIDHETEAINAYLARRDGPRQQSRLEALRWQYQNRPESVK